MFSFKNLKELRDKNPDEFAHFVRVSEHELADLRILYGPEAYRFDQKFPNTEEELLNEMWPSMRDKTSLDWFINGVFRSLNYHKNRERFEVVFPSQWHKMKDLTGIEKRAVQFLHEKGFMKLYSDGLLASQQMIDFLTREDLPELLKPVSIEIKDKKEELDVQKLRHKAHRLIVDGDRQRAYRLFLEKGFNEERILGIVGEMEDRYRDFRGLNKGIPSSKLEREVEEWLLKEKVFFFRHKYYSDLMPCDKKYTMDFFIPKKTIVEVRDPDNSMPGMRDHSLTLIIKGDVARRNGFEYIEITPKDDYKDKLAVAVRNAEIPEEAYDLDKIENPSGIGNTNNKANNGKSATYKYREPRFSPRSVHFWSNPIMKGMAVKV